MSKNTQHQTGRTAKQIVRGMLAQIKTMAEMAKKYKVSYPASTDMDVTLSRNWVNLDWKTVAQA